MVRLDPARVTLPASASALARGQWGARFYRALPAVGALAGLAIGGAVLAGWALLVPELARGMAWSAPSTPTSGLGVLLLGLALWVLRPDPIASGPIRSFGAADGDTRRVRVRITVARVAAATASLLALLSGLQWVTGVDLGVDHLLFAHTVDAVNIFAPNGPHGRMAGNSAVSIFVLGLALLLLDARALEGRTRRARFGRLVRWACAGIGLLTPYFAAVGYLFGVRRLYNPSGLFTGMAFNTAIALTLIAVGVTLARPARGVARLLAGDGAGALLLRRALPVTVLVPFVFGWLRIRGEELGYFPPRVGVAALVIAVSVVMVTTLTRAGAAAHRLAADRGRLLAEREAAREALGQSEADFREMADNLPQLAWMADETGRVFWYNRRWYDYTGTSPDLMATQGWPAVYHPDHVVRVLRGFRAALESGVPWEDTFPLRAANGEWRWFLSRANPIRITGSAVGGERERSVRAHGRPALRWFGTNTDVTAQRALEAERERLLVAERRARADAERASVEAAAASRAKSEFLATMSHELRTPLNAIAGHVQLVELGLHGPITDAQRTALARVQRAQRHLLGLINDVLNLARIEAGRIEYRPTVVDVADLAADVVALVAPQLASKHISFEVDVPVDPPLLAWVDREKTAQVLLNLLSNAAKFTDANGHVALEARAESGTQGTEHVVLRVRDTGRGIPVEDRARIFEPFVQLDSGYARQQEGTGLGLAISRDLARGMGGDLALATSAPMHGSVFVLTLPRHLQPNDVDRRTGEERRDGQRRESPDRRHGEDRREDGAAAEDSAPLATAGDY